MAAVVAVVYPTATAVTAEEPVPAPGSLAITPNAIQERSRPMLVEIGGIPPGTRVRLAVLRDCDLDGEPEESAECPPLLRRTSSPANADSVVFEELVIGDLEKEPGKLADVALWLRVGRPGSDLARWARFGYVADPCSFWSTVFETFLGGRCDPGLSQALRRHRGLESLVDRTFEVRLIDTTVVGSAPTPIPGTRGATGVAWSDAQTLLVTIAATVSANHGADAEEPGLYRITPTGDQERNLLWRPEDGGRPTAPYPLPGGRTAFVRQSLGTGVQDGLGGRVKAFLSVLDEDDTMAAEYPLPRKIHRFVAHDSDGEQLLALSLGEAENQPDFLRIDLTSGEVTSLGYHHALYHAALRSPVGPRAVVAFENAYGNYGWDLVLVDGDGQMVREVQMRPGHDLMPAWRPTGGVVAYLAEVHGEAGAK